MTWLTSSVPRTCAETSCVNPFNSQIVEPSVYAPASQAVGSDDERHTSTMSKLCATVTGGQVQNMNPLISAAANVLMTSSPNHAKQGGQDGQSAAVGARRFRSSRYARTGGVSR